GGQAAQHAFGRADGARGLVAALERLRARERRLRVGERIALRHQVDRVVVEAEGEQQVHTRGRGRRRAGRGRGRPGRRGNRQGGNHGKGTRLEIERGLVL